MEIKYQSREMAVPEIQPEHKAFWEAAAQGTLLIKRCKCCSEFHYYPRVHCPHCMSDETEWVEAKGTGTIYTYSVIRRDIPYAIAFVELDEGVRMMTNIIDCDFDSLQINQRVAVVFKQSGDGNQQQPFVPCFTPLT